MYNKMINYFYVIVLIILIVVLLSKRNEAFTDGSDVNYDQQWLPETHDPSQYISTYDLKPPQLYYTPFNVRYRVGEDPQNFKPLGYVFKGSQYYYKDV